MTSTIILIIKISKKKQKECQTENKINIGYIGLL